MAVRLATGPVCWGVDFADSPANPPWQQVLDDIGRSGYGWTELGPLGYLPEDPERLALELAQRQLRVAGSFVFQPLHDPAYRADVLAITRRTCELIAGVGGSHLVIIDLVSGERVATAGRDEAAQRLESSAWRALVEGIEDVAAIAVDFGLRPVLHPHVATYIEFEDEIERLLAALDERIGLCIDTGHCAYAGVDPVALYLRHRGRVSYLHLKDVDPVALARARATPLDFWAAIAEGVFCPLGEGIVDFPALADTLGSSGFDGWATVEQDREPSAAGDPLDDAIHSRLYLEAIGLAQPVREASAP